MKKTISVLLISSIPDTITSIGQCAFRYCSGLKSIDIPTGMTEISSSCFDGCTGLSELSIPSGIKTINGSAFSGCTGLQAITFVEGLTNIESSAFSNCSGVQEINLPAGVIEVGERAFSGCTNLQTVTIPNTVSAINGYAFSECSHLQNVTLPDGLTTIYAYAFQNCTNLEGIHLPDSITTMASYAFKGCSSLNTVNIPTGWTTVLDEGNGNGRYYSIYSPFVDCEMLKTIEIPDGLTVIPQYAFTSMSSLENITLPDTITSIGQYAFRYCSGINELKLPKELKTISSSTFAGCTGLRLITLNDNLRTIESSAFSGCHGLVSLVINDGLETLSDYAFGDCSNLTAVTVPKSVTDMSTSSFNDCSRLTIYCYSGSAAHMASESAGYRIYLLDEHEHIYKTSVETSPTCTRGGSQIKTCTICGYNYIEVLEPLGHGESVWKVSKEPTCTEDGIKEKRCTVCDELLGIEYINATGHDYSVTKVEATCTHAGYDLHHCNKCGNEYQDNKIDQLPHKYNEWIIDRPATLYSDGERHRDCSTCGKTERETIKKLGAGDVDTALGTVHFEIVDATSQKPISRANIYIYASEDEKYTLVTDDNGKLTQLLPVGKNKISVFAEGYIIRNLTITVVEGEQYLDKIGISTKPLVEGQLTAKEMTYDEIVAAGIDVNATGNNHVYKYEVNFDFGAEVDILSIVTYFLEDGTFVGQMGADGTSAIAPGYGGSGGSGGGGGGSLYYHSPDYIPDGTPGRGIPFTLSTGEDVTVYPVSENFYLIIRGEVRWLKEMFDVELVVFNNSTTDTIENCTATLELPDGLSLAEMVNEQQTFTQTIGNIDAALPDGTATSKTVHWYVRGDSEGSYDINANVQGIMMPFEEEFNYTYTAKDPIKVYAGSALQMTIIAPDSAFYGEDYPVRIELTNVSDKPIYGLSHKISEVKQGQITHYSNGTEVETVYTDEKELAYLHASEFKPGDKMVIEITTNIMFKSEVIQYQLDKLTNVVDDLERLMNLIEMAQAVEKATDILSGLWNFVSNTNATFDEVVKNHKFDSEAQAKATEKVADAFKGLLQSIEKEDTDTQLKMFNMLKKTWYYKELMENPNDPIFVEGLTLDKLASITASIKAIASAKPDSASADGFDIYTSIKRAIEAIPIRYVLENVSVTTLEGSTTEIPVTIQRTKVGAQYFGVDNIARYIFDLINAAIGEVDVPWYVEIMGISDPTKSKESEERIKVVEGQTSKFAAKTATGETKVKAWIEWAEPMDLTEGTSDGNFELSTDGKDATYENGVLSFTGDGFINVKPLSTTGGVLHIQMDDEEVETYALDVVENHTCSSNKWITWLFPNGDNKGYKIKKCDLCDDIIDIEEVQMCNEHTYGNYTLEKEKTDESDAIYSRTCDVCGYVDYIIGDAIPTIEGVNIAGYDQVFDGQPHTVSATVPDDVQVMYGTEKGKYDLSSAPEYTDAGKYNIFYMVSKEGYPSFEGSAIVNIEQKELTESMLHEIAPQKFTGKQIIPTIVIEDGTPSILTSEDYIVTYGNNITVEDGGTVTISGQRNYTGTITRSFDITKAESEIVSADVSGTYGDEVTLSVDIDMKQENAISLQSVSENKVEFKLGDTLIGTADVVYSDSLNNKGVASTIITLDKKFNVGVNTVTVEYGGSGNLLGSNEGTISVEVKPLSIEYTVTASNREYDGSTSVDLEINPTNILENDSVILNATGNIKAPDVGKYSEVSISETNISGTDAAYYSFTAPNGYISLTSDVMISDTCKIVSENGECKIISGTPVSGLIITANYDNNGALLSIHTEPVDKINIYKFTPQTDNASSTTIMLWESLNKMTPLCGALKINATQ